VTHLAPNYLSEDRLTTPRLVIGLGWCNVLEGKVALVVHSWNRRGARVYMPKYPEIPCLSS